MACYLPDCLWPTTIHDITFLVSSANLKIALFRWCPSIYYGWHIVQFPIQKCVRLRRIPQGQGKQGVARRRTGRTPHKQTRSLTQRLRKKAIYGWKLDRRYRQGRRQRPVGGLELFFRGNNGRGQILPAFGKVVSGGGQDLFSGCFHDALFESLSFFMRQGRQPSVKSPGTPFCRCFGLVDIGTDLQDRLFYVFFAVVAGFYIAYRPLIYRQRFLDMGVAVGGETKTAVFRAVKRKSAIGTALFPDFAV